MFWICNRRYSYLQLVVIALLVGYVPQEGEVVDSNHSWDIPVVLTIVLATLISTQIYRVETKLVDVMS